MSTSSRSSRASSTSARSTRAPKSSATVETSTPVVSVPVAVVSESSAPVETPAPKTRAKSTRVKKTAEPVTEAEVPIPTLERATNDAASSSTDAPAAKVKLSSKEAKAKAFSETESFMTLFSEFVEALPSADKETAARAKALSKRSTALSKELRKALGVKAPSRGLPLNSGLNKPQELSPSLCEFLKEPVGTMLSRQVVNKRLYDYIKDNKLFANETNHKVIKPNAKLEALLDQERDRNEEINYFSLQKMIKHHYPTTAKKAAK